MFGSEILETAIGLAFVYVLLSLTCTVLTESFARVLNLRGVMLKRAIRQMVFGVFDRRLFDLTWTSTLNESSQPDATDKNNKSGSADHSSANFTVDAFYQHGLIKPMHKTAFGLWQNSPSYIAPRIFALALIDIVRQFGAPTATEKNGDNDQKPPANPGDLKAIAQEPELETFKKLVDALPPNSPLKQSFQILLTQRQLPASQALSFDAQQLFQEMENAVNGIQTTAPQLYSALSPLLNAAKAKSTNWQGAYDNLIAELEEWFNDTMDRVGGWYGRQSRFTVFLIAIGVTILFNVDSLAVGSAIYTNSTLRQAIVSAATNYVQNDATQSNSASTLPTAADAPNSGQPVTNTQTSQTPSLVELQKEIMSLGLPIGWQIADGYQCGMWDQLLCMTEFQQLTQNPLATSNEPQASPQEESRLYPIPAGQMASKLAGLALTILALSLGAPFWFDLLKKFVNMRSSGDVPATNGSS